MRLVVSGSSGLIGTALVSSLRSHGHTVVRLVRRPASATDEITWDPTAGSLASGSLDGVDAVINLSGAGIGDKRWTSAYKRELLDSRLRTTELLARSIAEAEQRPSAFLSGSAIGWYGPRGDEELTETSAPGSSFLADICRQWETATAAADAAGVRTAHLRTGIVLAAGGGALKKQLPLFKLGAGGRFGSGRQWQSWISLDDEVAAIEHLLAADVAGPVNLTAPHPVTNREFAKVLGKVLQAAGVVAHPLVRTQVAPRRRTRRCAAVHRSARGAVEADRLGLHLPAPDPRGRAARTAGAMTPPSGQVDAIVVGAGLAGLCAARHLQRAGRDVVVLEASDGVGGRVRSDQVDGFTLDRGFQVLLTAYPEARRQLDLTALRLQAFDPGAEVHIGSKFHVVGDPLRRPSTLVSTVLTPIGSPVDKLRLLALRHRVRSTPAGQLLRGTDEPTLAHLQAAGFSPRMIDRFFRPLFGGIQLDPSLASSARMFDVIFQMLSIGDSAVPAAGMGAIPAQLAAGLAPGTLRLGHHVSAIETTATGRAVRLGSGDVVAARTVIVATEGPTAAALLGLSAVGSKHVACVYFAAPTAPTANKYVVLDGTRSGPVLNVAVMSNVAPTYAPAGQHLVAAAIPDPAADLDLEAAARRQLRSWWGGQVDAWQHLRTYRIAHGQPDQSPPFHPRQRVALGDGLYVCGDHRDTASIQGALFSGRRCAEAVVVATAS